MSCGRKQSGGRVSMPIEYFGGESGRYFGAGSPELMEPMGAVSHGVSLSNELIGPDYQEVFSGNASNPPSGTQTGGRKKPAARKSPSKRRRSSQKRTKKGKGKH